MVNTRYNDVRPIALVNALVEEPTTKGHGWGCCRGRARGRGRERVAHARDEDPFENAPMNEYPLVHNEDIKEDTEVCDVEEVG